MKNLLVITLFFLSIGVMAEDNYRCKFFKTCEDKNCTSDVQTYYVSLKVNEGWFRNELFFNGIDFSEYTLFGENLLQWGTYPPADAFLEEDLPGIFNKYAPKYKFDKTSLVLETFISFKEPQKSKIPGVYKDYKFAQDEFLCEKIN